MEGGLNTSKKYTMTVFQSSLVWFGAGVSIAEILTGTYFAPLGFTKGLLAILLGHLIGCTLMYFAGIIGGRARRSSMETTKMSFGRFGGVFFAFLNVLQLVGWTAIMIYDGAGAVNELFHVGAWIWAIVIGALILVWILVGLTNLGWINKISMAALFILTIVLCGVIFRGSIPKPAASEAMSFGAAVELAVAMPLSWLPLISDYTREAEKPGKATLASVLVYGLISVWMYIIGMGAALYTGESDIAKVMAKAGLGVAALVILILSTVTTTFLDAWSAGISTESLTDKLKGKGRTVAAIVTVIGTIGAVLFNMDDITSFLYLIGSVFAPMIAVQIADFFFLKEDHFDEKIQVKNLIIWVIGFILYRYLMTVDLPLGNTLPDMVITMVICLVVHLFSKSKSK
ncbi:MAG: putative hydroxymethylpyrimidine transporter CytX [Lachnospiraceae bacterium]|jgi:putative hydroxymethylpyrimidine transporter CytX|nr:putative hydroxymethylpyrimidine transporter CytX [Lachnospiraceae bacterium]